MPARPLHIDMAGFERNMREAFAIPIPEPLASDPVIQSQYRAREAVIQFALWFIGELHLGTDPADTIEACAKVIGGMLLNVEETIKTPEGKSTDKIIANLRFVIDQLAEDSDMDIGAKYDFIEGGHA